MIQIHSRDMILSFKRSLGLNINGLYTFIQLRHKTASGLSITGSRIEDSLCLNNVAVLPIKPQSHALSTFFQYNALLPLEVAGKI